MINMAALRALAKAGVPADAILDAIEASQQVEAEKVERRRAADRERKRQAAFRRNPPESAALHRNPPDGLESENALSSSLLPSFQEKHSGKEERKERAKSNRGEVCPDNFRPSEGHYEAAARQQISRSKVDSLGEDMRSWSKSNANRAVARKSDWSAAMYQWIKREAEKGNSNGHQARKNGTHPAPGHAQTRDDAILAGMARVARSRGLLDEPAGRDRTTPGGLDLAGGPDAKFTRTIDH